MRYAFPHCGTGRGKERREQALGTASDL